MNSFRYLEDQKRGYPTTVGALAKLVTRHGLQRFLTATPEEIAQAREELEVVAGISDDAGEKLSVFDGIESLTAGQHALLCFKVRR